MPRRRDDRVTRLLEAARRRITDQARWTAFTPARRPLGAACDPYDPHAVAWCAVGALMVERRAAGLPHAVLYRATARLTRVTGPADERGPLPIEYVNDHEGHAAVLAVFDAAIRAK